MPGLTPQGRQAAGACLCRLIEPGIDARPSACRTRRHVKTIFYVLKERSTRLVPLQRQIPLKSLTTWAHKKTLVVQNQPGPFACWSEGSALRSPPTFRRNGYVIVSSPRGWPFVVRSSLANSDGQSAEGTANRALNELLAAALCAPECRRCLIMGGDCTPGNWGVNTRNEKIFI